MSHAKAKGEATDLVHEDFFVIDIRKLCSRSTAGGDNESNFPSEGRSTFPRNAEALEDVDYLHIGPSGAFESREATDKINLQFELESANIFLKKENGKAGHLFHCSLSCVTNITKMSFQMLSQYAGSW